MHNEKFISLLKASLLDVALALELYEINSLPIVNTSRNISSIYDHETGKFAMSKVGLRCALPSEVGYSKCIMASNHFCTLSMPQHKSNTHYVYWHCLDRVALINLYLLLNKPCIQHKVIR